MPSRRPKIRRTSSLPGLDSTVSTNYSQPEPQYSFTFTTNLTPNTFQHADKLQPTTQDPIPHSPTNSTSSRKRGSDVLDEFYTDKLPARKEDAHTRKFSEGHIPRPPNAFILFRSDLVARKAVPTSLEADHSTISKIIGVCWRTLPARQRKRWEQKALEAKAAHKKLYPDYRYTPVHRKGTARKKAKKEQKKDDQRCEELAQLLLSGHKGADLEDQVKRRDAAIAAGQPLDAFPTQFTFVQSAYPVASTSGIDLPSAPLVPRRHSSAPPTDGLFDPTSSAASTPLGRSVTLQQDGTSPTNDELIPLARLSRKLPTHKVKPFQSTVASYPSTSMHPVPPKKVKSSLSKAVKARGNGRFVPETEATQLQGFIQSHWSSVAAGETDPSDGKKGKKARKGAASGIPQELVIAPWAASAPQYTFEDANSAPATDGQYDVNSALEEINFSQFHSDYQGGIFDFGTQFSGLETEENGDDYQYYYAQPEYGSAPTSATGTSPHTSDGEEAAVYHSPNHPYQTPVTSGDAIPPPQAVYGGVMPTPDWSAFDGCYTTSNQIPTQNDSVQQSPALQSYPPYGQQQYEYIYPPLPDSAPGSEHGDDGSEQAPYYSPAQYATAAGVVHYGPPSGAPGYLASPTTDITEQLGHFHVRDWMDAQAQHSPQLPSYSAHHQQPPVHYPRQEYSMGLGASPVYSPTAYPQTHDANAELVDSTWADWTVPDPFAQGAAAGGSNSSAALDPLTPATGVVNDAGSYRA